MFWVRLLALVSVVGVVCFGNGTVDASSVYNRKIAQLSKKALLKSTVHTCQSATEFALRNNPEYRAALAKIRIYVQKLRASRLFPTNPEIEILGKGKLKTSSGKIEPLPYKWENSLTWKLPIGGRWIRRQRLAQATLTRVQREVRVKRLGIVLKVQSVCYKLLVAQQKRALYQQLVAFYQRVFGLIKRRKQTGAATILDMNLARMELLQNQAALALAIADVKANTEALILRMGWTRRTRLVVRDAASLRLPAIPNVGTLLQRAQKHVVLRALQMRVQELQAMLAWAYAKGIPDIKLKAYYALEDNWGHVIGGGLSIPIPIIQRNQDKVWSTQAKIRQAKLILRAAQFRIQQRVKQSFVQYNANISVLRLYEKQLLPTFRQQLKLNERGLRLGSFTILKVISAQQSQNKALLQRINVLKQSFDGFIALQEAMGSLLALGTP